MERDWFLQAPETGRQLGGCGELGAVKAGRSVKLERCSQAGADTTKAKVLTRKRPGEESCRRQALFAVIVKRVSPFSTARRDGRLCPYKGGSRRVTLEKSLNCGVNYLL